MNLTSRDRILMYVLPQGALKSEIAKITSIKGSITRRTRAWELLKKYSIGGIKSHVQSEYAFTLRNLKALMNKGLIATETISIKNGGFGHKIYCRTEKGSNYIASVNKFMRETYGINI